MKKYGLLIALLALISCQKEEPLVVSPERMNLYVGESAQITTNGQNVTYKSFSESCVSVSTSGFVTAKKAGSTRIMVESESGRANIPVDVMPVHNLYPDMDHYIGRSIFEMTRKFGAPTSSNDNFYIYTNVSEYATALGANVANGIITDIMVLVPIKYSSILADYLLERYTPVDTFDDGIVFLKRDVIIYLELYELQNVYFMSVFYIKRKNSNVQKMDTEKTQTICEHLRQLPLRPLALTALTTAIPNGTIY